MQETELGREQQPEDPRFCIHIRFDRKLCFPKLDRWHNKSVKNFPSPVLSRKDSLDKMEADSLQKWAQVLVADSQFFERRQISRILLDE